jgi:hypothetical protein
MGRLVQQQVSTGEENSHHIRFDIHGKNCAGLVKRQNPRDSVEKLAIEAASAVAVVLGAWS